MICDGIAIILTGSQGTGCWKFPTGAENISFVGTWQWGEYQLRSAASPLALFYSEQTLTHTHAHAHALSLSHTQTIVIGICKTQEKGILGKKRRQVQLRNGFSISRRASAWVRVCVYIWVCVWVSVWVSKCVYAWVWREKNVKTTIVTFLWIRSDVIRASYVIWRSKDPLRTWPNPG